jgi:hypothetical protein
MFQQQIYVIIVHQYLAPEATAINTTARYRQTHLGSVDELIGYAFCNRLDVSERCFSRTSA